MSDGKGEKDYFTENEFYNATGINERTRKKYEAEGWITPALSVNGASLYSHDTVELAQAIRRYAAGGLPVAHAYHLALHGRPLKRLRSSAAYIGGRQTIDPREIPTHPTFEGLLCIDKNFLMRMAADMRACGYYRSAPVVVGVWPEQPHPVLIDGHTRVEAAIMAEIKRIFVEIEDFADELAALQHAMSLQCKRRTTDSGVQARLIMQFDRLRQRGGDRRTEAAQSKTSVDVFEKRPPASSHITAALAGCSPTTVERFRRILKEGPAGMLKAVLAGKMKIRTAHDKIVKKAQNTDKTRSRAELSKEIAKVAALLLGDDKLLDSLRKHGGTLADHLYTALQMYVSYLEPTEHAEKASDPAHSHPGGQ